MADLNESKHVLIRKATVDDAEFVAKTVWESRDRAVGLTEGLKRSCSRENSLYSWTNAYLAVVDGEVVGCLIAYDGRIYMERRNDTWADAWYGEVFRKNGIDLPPETREGEFYLDSLFVVEEQRRKGIATNLVNYVVDANKEKGFEKATVFVLNETKVAQMSLYENVGFTKIGPVSFGNETSILLAKAY